VLNQSYLRCDLVIVDDNGRETAHQVETAKLMQKYADEPRVSYLVLEENRGGGGARNAGIQHSQSSYIGFLDDDDEWLPDFVQRHLDVFRHTNADVVYCGYNRLHEGDSVIREEESIFYRGEVFEMLLRGWCPVRISCGKTKKRHSCVNT